MKMLDPWKARGLKMVDDLPRRVNGYIQQPAMRWTKDANGRVLPLNSAAWRKLRKQVLAEEPLCRHCAAQGLTVPATEVDHIDNTRGPNYDTDTNLQAVCKTCHKVKTQQESYRRRWYRRETQPSIGQVERARRSNRR